MKTLYTLLFSLFIFIHSFSQSLYFPPNSGSNWDTISPSTYNWCQPKIDSLYNYLDSNNTKAFVLLKDGKIVLEKYFGTHTSTSLWQWASAGKTITSFMVGIAQQENYLKITDTSSTYLGQGWTDCTPTQESKITIKNQLSMTSGLDDGVPDHFCTIDTCLKYKADAGTRWAYHNGPYTLLDKVIQNSTGVTLNAYTNQKLKIPTGMTGSFAAVGYNNVFFSTARSMSRFGLLMLNKGNWNGNQIMTDTAYFNQLINTSQSLNQSYGYLWWLNGKSSFLLPGSQFAFSGSLNPNAPVDAVFAMGKDGQFLNVVPSQNMVWIRMGDAPDNLPVPYLMNDKIWEYINNLSCSTNNLSDINQSTIDIYPNPSNGIFNVRSDKYIQLIELFNIQGKLLKTIVCNQKEIAISLIEIDHQIFIAKFSFQDNSKTILKLVK
jgi:CubicO group peptidase (beta-lactamase class C family)